MKEVLKALDLPEDAEETSAVQAVNALKGRVTDAEKGRDTAMNRVTELEKADLDAKVTKALDDHKDKITAANKADVEAALRKDCDGTLKVLAAVKVVEKAATALNRADGKAPDGQSGGEIATNKQRLWSEYEAIKDPAEKTRFYRKHKNEMKD